MQENNIVNEKETSTSTTDNKTPVSGIINGVRFGDVFYFNLPTDREGYEITSASGSRPCVIVSNDKTNAFSYVVTVCPITSTEKVANISHVPVHCGTISGTILVDQIMTISKTRLKNYAAALDSETQAILRQSLIGFFGGDGETISSASDGEISYSVTDNSEISVLRGELNAYKSMYRSLVEKLVSQVKGRLPDDM